MGGGSAGRLQVYPCLCCIQVVFSIYIYVHIYIKSQLSIFVLFAFYNHGKQCLSVVLFWSILFLSGAVYSFKQNNDDTKIAAACAEGWHLNCPEPSLSPSPQSWCIALSISSFHDRGSRRCPGTKTNARHVEPGRQRVFYGFIFSFFLLDLAPFCRPSGSTHVFVSLSLFYSLCSVLLFWNQSGHVVLFVMLSFSKETCWGQEYSPLIGGGKRVSATSCLPKKLRETYGNDVWSTRN